MNHKEISGGRRSAKRRNSKRRSSTRRTAKRRNIKRGGDASQHAIAVYGNMGEQHAGEGNVIATKMQGGDALASIAVPAVLIAANQLYKPKNRFFKKSSFKRRYKGGESSSLMNALNASTATMDTLNENIGGANTTPPGIMIAGAPPTPADFAAKNIPVSSTGGGSPSELKPSYGGVGVLDDIAVPAVLIAANRLYKRNQRAYTGSKRRFSRRRR